MGKLLIVSISDHEEHILNKIMEIIADEPELDHIALPPSNASLSFPHLEIRLKEQTVSCSGQAVWAADGEHCGTAVASVIGQIRRKLTPDTPKGGYIRTVLGSGYKFNSSPF